MAERQLMVEDVKDLQRKDLKLWPLFSILDKDFLFQIKMVMWYGWKNESVNWETALILMENKDIYRLRTKTLKTISVISILPPQKVEALCQKDIKIMIHIDGCSFVLTEEGKVYSWGLNRNGMCGHGIDNAIISNCYEISGLADKCVVKLNRGSFHVLVLTDNGKMYSWGRNNYGQVNHTDVDMIRTPTEVIIEDEFGKKDIQSISCGFTFNMAITCDGELYSWGENTYGQLGLGHHSEIRHKPIKIMLNAATAKVKCGYEHTLALTREGLLYAWGKNDNGQLGIGSCVNYISYPVPINTKKIGKIIDIATQYDSTKSAAVNEDNHIFMWGLYTHESRCYLRPTDINFNTIHDVFIDYENFIKLHNSCRNEQKLKTFLDTMSETNLETAFNNSMSADVKLIVNQESIYIHKNVIMIRCPQMYAEFFAHKTDNVIVGYDFSLVAYKSFLKYLYTRTVDLPDEKPLEVYTLASSYGDEIFSKNCINKIKQRITILNVMDFYVEAISRKIEELKEFCFKYAINNLTVVVKTEGYAKLSEKIRFDFMIKAANARAFRKRARPRIFLPVLLVLRQLKREGHTATARPWNASSVPRILNKNDVIKLLELLAAHHSR